MIIDECSNFMHPGMDIDGMLSEMRKFKLSIVLATQFPDQLRSQVRKSAFTNVGILLSFNVDIDDAKIMAERMEGVDPTDFTRQVTFECIARIRNTPVPLRVSLPNIPKDDFTEYIRQRMSALKKANKKHDDQDDGEAGSPRKRRTSSFVKKRTSKGIAVCEGVR